MVVQDSRYVGEDTEKKFESWCRLHNIYIFKAVRDTIDDKIADRIIFNPRTQEVILVQVKTISKNHPGKFSYTATVGPETLGAPLLTAAIARDEPLEESIYFLTQYKEWFYKGSRSRPGYTGNYKKGYSKTRFKFSVSNVTKDSYFDRVKRMVLKDGVYPLLDESRKRLLEVLDENYLVSYAERKKRLVVQKHQSSRMVKKDRISKSIFVYANRKGG